METTLFYFIFYFLDVLKKIILKNLVSYQSIQLSTLNFVAQL